MSFGLMVMAALLAGAPPAPVVSYDPANDFTHYGSYSWVFLHPPANMDPTLYRQVHAAIDRSLRAHGFVRSEPTDFAVAFTVGQRTKMHASDYGHYAFYYSPAEAAGHQDWVNREIANRVNQDNTLTIDIYDARTRHSVWHGIALVPIVPQTRQAIIEHEVSDVLSQFPPKRR